MTQSTKQEWQHIAVYESGKADFATTYHYTRGIDKHLSSVP